jgi:hypothetical protein
MDTQEQIFAAFEVAAGKERAVAERVQAARLRESLASVAAPVARAAGPSVTGQKQTSYTTGGLPSAAELAAAPAPPQSLFSTGSAVMAAASLGLIPLGVELWHLFGGSSTPPPEPLIKYAMPESLSFSAADSGAGGGASFAGADSDQFGMARAVAPPVAEQPELPARAAAPTAPAAGPGPQWLQDHAFEVAAAVRSAALQGSNVYDTLSDF